MKYEKTALTYEQAKEKALKYLDYRSHSEYEIREKLRHAGADTDIIERVAEFLTEYKLIDDTDYAKRYSRDLQNLRRLGKARIRTELKKKGIKNDIIEIAISDLPEQSEELLFELVKKRMKGDINNRDKVLRYFLYRGYCLDEIKKCINSINFEE